MTEEEGDIISNINMAYHAIKRADSKAKKSTKKTTTKPKQTKVKAKINKNKVILKAEATQTLPRGQIHKMQDHLYLQRIKKSKNVKVTRTKKGKKALALEKQKEMKKKFKYFLLTKQYDEMKVKYLSYKIFTRWIKRYREAIEKKKNQYKINPNDLLLSNPNIVVDEKRDQVCQDDNSLIVNQKIQEDMKLKLSSFIENSSNKVKKLYQTTPVISIDKKEEKEEPKEIQKIEKENDENKDNKNIKKIRKKRGHLSDSSDYGMYDFEEPELDESDQDLFDEANKVLSRAISGDSTKPIESIKTTDLSPMKVNESSKKPAKDNRNKEETKANEEPKEMKEERIVQLFPSDPNYLEYTEKLLSKYEKEDFRRGLPKYERVSKERHEVNSNSDSDSYDESNESMTEMKLTNSALDDKEISSAGNFSDRIAAVIDYGRDIKTSNASNTETLVYPSPVSKKTKPRTTFIINEEEENNETNTEDVIQEETVSLNLKAGKDLIAEADAILYKEEEENSEVFQPLPKKTRFNKEMEMIAFDHEIDINELKQKKNKESIRIIEEEEEINEEMLKDIEDFVSKLNSNNNKEIIKNNNDDDEEEESFENHIDVRKEKPKKVEKIEEKEKPKAQKNKAKQSKTLKQKEEKRKIKSTTTQIKEYSFDLDESSDDLLQLNKEPKKAKQSIKEDSFDLEESIDDLLKTNKESIKSKQTIDKEDSFDLDESSEEFYRKLRYRPVRANKENSYKIEKKDSFNLNGANEDLNKVTKKEDISKTRKEQATQKEVLSDSNEKTKSTKNNNIKELELQLERLNALKTSESSESDSSDVLLSDDYSPKKSSLKYFVSIQDAVKNGKTIKDKKVKNIIYTSVVSNSSDADMAVVELSDSSNDSTGKVRKTLL